MIQSRTVACCKRTVLGVAVVSASLGLSSQVHAQKQLEEVIVTAQKRSQSANDVGITINAFTGQQIRDFGVFTAEDIAMRTPGLTVNETAATGVPLYTIRGVGFQDYSTAASSTVGIYFDEVNMPYTVMTRGLVFDQERVEVLKGPQGDLYGRNTTAGQINFISNKPTEEFEAGIIGSVGNYESYDLEGYISGGTSFAQGRLAFKTTQSDEGWQKSTTSGDELGEKDAYAVRGIANFNFTDNLRVQAIAHYVNDESDNRANTPYDGRDEGLDPFNNPYTPLEDYFLPTGSNFGETPPWYATDDNEAAGWTNSYTSPITGRTFDLRPQRDNELKGASIRLDWDLGNMTLTSITGYNDFEREEANDWDGGFYNDSSNINTTDLDVFSQEIRLTGEWGDDVTWIGGLYYSDDDMDEYYHYFMSDSVFGFGSIPWGVDLFAPTPILELDTKYSQDTESAAIFGHVEWQFTENWRLTLGARYTSEDRDWKGCTFVADDGSLGNFLNAQFGANLGPGDCGTINDDPDSPDYIFAVIGTPAVNNAFQPFKDDIDTDKWMWKTGLDYTLTDDILLYGTVSFGFKSGGFNGANSNTTQQLQPYDEEELTAYELGAKMTLLDGTMQLNTAAFYYDYEDKQEQDAAVTFVGNISGLTNVPESEIYGAELDMNWLPTDRLTFSLGVAWLDTEIEKWDAVDRDASAWPVTVTRDVSGAELAQSPDWQYTALAKYEWPLGDAFMMEIAGDVSYTDETTGGINPEEATEDYTIVGARLGISAADGTWRALLWGRNLTDEDYYPSAYTGGNGPFVRSYGMPLTYGVTLSYFFGP
jgi:iron complex outermembrane receptor protein